MKVSDQRFLIAGYGMPAEFAIMSLFSLGVLPEKIAVMTHAKDSRNEGLHNIISLRRIEYYIGSPQEKAGIDFVSKFSPDILLSLHYRLLIPNEILKACRLGGVNLHPSLLPKYRGANSSAWAIINNEKETGFTFHRMDSKFDNGNILLQQKTPINSWDTGFSLFHRLIVNAMIHLEKVIYMIMENNTGYEQSGEISYYSRSLPYDGKITSSMSLSEIERFIRAMFFPPFKGAMLEINKEVFEISSIEEYKKIMASSHKL